MVFGYSTDIAETEATCILLWIEILVNLTSNLQNEAWQPSL